MAFRKVKFLEGEIFHVYNRGNSRNQIFHDKEDYDRFIKIIHLSNGQKKFKVKDIKKYQKDLMKIDVGERVVNILSYVLMPNHFHFMIELSPVPSEGVGGINKNFDNNLSAFMKRIQLAYSMYYNRKYKKTGSLFGGRFKAEHIVNDQYLKYLFAYIHLNPIKLIQSDWKESGIYDPKKAKDFLESYDWSSFADYFVNPNRLQGKIVSKETFLNKIANSNDLQKDMLEWLSYKYTG